VIDVARPGIDAALQVEDRREANSWNQSLPEEGAHTSTADALVNAYAAAHGTSEFEAEVARRLPEAPPPTQCTPQNPSGEEFPQPKASILSSDGRQLRYEPGISAEQEYAQILHAPIAAAGAVVIGVTLESAASAVKIGEFTVAQIAKYVGYAKLAGEFISREHETKRESER